jgi:hypothetical protein
VNLECTFARNPGVIARRIAGETILVPVNHRASEMALFTLNEVGTFVWERLDGARPLSSITGELEAIFDVEALRVSADVLEFVDQLEQVGCALDVGPLSFEAGKRSGLRNDEGNPAPHPGAVDSRHGIHRTHHALQSPLCPRLLRK